jgi:hypothetical protein
MKLPHFEFKRPQQVAALLLLCFIGQCLWVVHHQTISESDYQYARCGREMWERPSPIPGYFTTCGNFHDGTLAYRVAGLPLTVQFLANRAIDRLRKPENREFTGEDASTSTWEMRHQLSYVLLLLRLPFIGFGLWLGGALWWVSRRLFGNAGGALALALYCFSPPIIAACVAPNNEILVAWGLYGIIYTAIGVAHAMYGPRRKWRPRIALLAVALGLTACAHIAAALIGLVLAVILMMYLAEGRRGAVFQVAIMASAGALFILIASYAFQLSAFEFVIRSAAARVWMSPAALRGFATNLTTAGTATAAFVALFFYATVRRSRYFGNTVPLGIFLLLALLITTGTQSRPFLWAVPFLLTFIGGVFADLFEARQRRTFVAIAIALALTQAALSLAALHLLTG